MKTFTQHINESSLSRIWKHSKDHNTGTISAFRNALDCNKGAKLTRKQNKARNVVLKAKLIKAGFGVTTVAGTYIENYGTPDAVEVDEESFFVVDLKDNGTLLKTLKVLGEEFEQDSITYSEKGGENYILFGTNKCEKGHPGYGKRVKLGKALFSDDGEFFSKVKGRPFVFKKITENITSYEELSRLGRQGISVLAETSWVEYHDLNVDSL